MPISRISFLSRSFVIFSLFLAAVSTSLWWVIYGGLDLDLDKLGLTDRVLGAALLTGFSCGLILVATLIMLAYKKLEPSLPIILVVAITTVPVLATIYVIWELAFRPWIQ